MCLPSVKIAFFCDKAMVVLLITNMTIPKLKLKPYELEYS